MAIIKKIDTASAGEGVEHHQPLLVEISKVQPLWKTAGQLLKICNVEFPCGRRILYLLAPPVKPPDVCIQQLNYKVQDELMKAMGPIFVKYL